MVLTPFRPLKSVFVINVCIDLKEGANLILLKTTVMWTKIKNENYPQSDCNPWKLLGTVNKMKDEKKE